MPYVLKNPDRELLDPHILKVCSKVVSLLTERGINTPPGAEAQMWGYMRFIAINVIKETALNAAKQYQGERRIRYWLVVDHAGIALNIAFETIRRIFDHYRRRRPINICLNRQDNIGFIPANSDSLNKDLAGLICAISDLAGPDKHNYDGAYNGEVNYSMFELMPRIVMAVRRLQGNQFTLIDVEKIVLFWAAIAKELYADVAGPYEDDQKEKPTNGDVSVIALMLDQLKDNN